MTLSDINKMDFEGIGINTRVENFLGRACLVNYETDEVDLERLSLMLTTKEVDKFQNVGAKTVRALHKIAGLEPRGSYAIVTASEVVNAARRLLAAMPDSERWQFMSAICQQEL